MRDPFGAGDGHKEVRPTTGKTLNALMSILGPLNGLRFADFFSGTGRVGLFAYQRGAEVVTVELLPARSKALAATFKGGGTHLCMDVRRAAKWLENKGWVFDVIFADPPYGMKWNVDFPKLIGAHQALLAPGGRLVLEHHKDEKVQPPEGFVLVDERRYGQCSLTFFAREEEDERA